MEGGLTAAFFASPPPPPPKKTSPPPPTPPPPLPPLLPPITTTPTPPPTPTVYHSCWTTNRLTKRTLSTTPKRSSHSSQRHRRNHDSQHGVSDVTAIVPNALATCATRHSFHFRSLRFQFLSLLTSLATPTQSRHRLNRGVSDVTASSTVPLRSMFTPSNLASHFTCFSLLFLFAFTAHGDALHRTVSYLSSDRWHTHLCSFLERVAVSLRSAPMPALPSFAHFSHFSH
jgi:hypothetical protein